MVELKVVSIQNIFGESSCSDDYFYSINYHISTALMEYRIVHSLNQKQLALKLNVSPSMISKYENGDYNFTLRQICDICDVINIDIDVTFKAEK